jgi:hypothetical protein
MERSLLRQGKPSFCVKWTGYGDAENTWEPLENVQHLDALKEYFTAHPDKKALLKNNQPGKKGSKKGTQKGTNKDTKKGTQKDTKKGIKQKLFSETPQTDPSTSPGNANASDEGDPPFSHLSKKQRAAEWSSR